MAVIDQEDQLLSGLWAADYLNLDGQLVLTNRHLLVFQSVEFTQKKEGYDNH